LSEYISAYLSLLLTDDKKCFLFFLSGCDHNDSRIFHICIFW